MGKYVKKDLKNLISKLKEDSNSKGSSSDENTKYWRPELAKEDESSEYVVRFLPSVNSDFPWENLHQHMFKFANGNFISFLCPKRHKKGNCPLCDELDPLWKSDKQSDKNKALKMYAKPRHITNILVVKDPRNDGANEGKIFTFQYGKQIQDILQEELYDEDEGCIFFDPEDGANFKIKMDWTGKGNDKYPSYLKSKFINKGSVVSINGKELDEDEIDELMEKRFDLKKEFLSDDKFMTEEQIRESLKQQKYVSKAELNKDGIGEEVKSKDQDDDDKVEPVAKENKKPKKIDYDDDDDDDDDLIDSVDDDDDDDDLDAMLNDMWFKKEFTKC